jgi:hypothetical protein
MKIEWSNQQPYSKYGITLLAALMMSACGELSYKRGASANDLTQSKQSCQAENTTPTAINNCMVAHGWTVHNLDETQRLDSELVAEAFINPDNRQIISRPPTAANKLATDQAAQPITTKKIAGPMDIFIISSWWKLGGGADNLKQSTAECVSILGEEHNPKQNTRAVTRGLLLCMKDKGWRGLREK